MFLEAERKQSGTQRALGSVAALVDRLRGSGGMRKCSVLLRRSGVERIYLELQWGRTTPPSDQRRIYSGV